MRITYSKLSRVGICNSAIESWCKGRGISTDYFSRVGVDPEAEEFKNDHSLQKCYRLLRRKGIN